MFRLCLILLYHWSHSQAAQEETGVKFTWSFSGLMAMISVVSVHRTSDRRRLELVQSESYIYIDTYIYIHIYVYIYIYPHIAGLQSWF